MEISTFTNQEIQITSVYFRKNRNGQQLQSYPRRMVYAGQEYNFVEYGMSYLVQKGQDFIKLFDVSDGQMQYRLRLDKNQWTLVGVKA